MKSSEDQFGFQNEVDLLYLSKGHTIIISFGKNVSIRIDFDSKMLRMEVHSF